jgi:hypothetical protein
MQHGVDFAAGPPPAAAASAVAVAVAVDEVGFLMLNNMIP